jgi:hypothetical protein
MKYALLWLSVVFPVVDNGQFQDVDPLTRKWFESVRNQNGVPCCSIADGHRTDYEIRSDGYWVPLGGGMQHVPPEAVVRNAGNPFDTGIVWYVTQIGQGPNHSDVFYIRCFVPTSDV